MKLELKNIKYAVFASQETSCYAATIWVDDKKVGTVENNGCGGCDIIRPHAVEQRINEWVAPETAETIFGELLLAWLQERDLKRLLARRILFTRNHRVLQTNSFSSSIELKKRLGEVGLLAKLNAEEILNLLPFPRALVLYLGFLRGPKETQIKTHEVKP